MSSISVTSPWVIRNQMENFSITRRPLPVSQQRLPLGIRSVCWATLPPGHFEDREIRPFTKLLWGIRGTARVSFGDREQVLMPGQVAIWFPATRQRAQALGEPWEARWFTMDGPLAADIPREFGFSREGVYTVGPAPVELFEEIRTALEDVSPQGECRADALGYRLLGMAASRSQLVEPHPLVDAACAILETEWHDPALDIALLAKRLHSHRSMLSRLFKAARGISPSQYLIRLRLRHSLSLLKQTQLPIKEIAYRCGFANANYFARVFRRTQHLTPQQWRQS